MRINGVVDSARGLVPHGHLCWAYEDRTEFHARASEYMADVIAAGQWIEYVGSGCAEELCEQLAGIDVVKQALDNGAAGVCSVDDFYAFRGHSDVVDPVPAVAARCAELFATTLARTLPMSSALELVIEGRDLEFVDHRSLLTLVESARRSGMTVVLLRTTLRSPAARVIEFLDLADLRVAGATWQ